MPDPRDAFVIPFFHQIDQLGLCHSICRVCFQSASENTKLITGEEQHQFKGVTTELGELRPEQRYRKASIDISAGNEIAVDQRVRSRQ
jgi:hypothetical protein